MSEDFSFYDELMKFKEKAEKAWVPPPKKELSKVELTLNQKRVIVNYMLCGVSKGIFEDCPEFWEGVKDVDGTYPSLRRAAEEFVEGLKERILKELT